MLVRGFVPSESFGRHRPRRDRLPLHLRPGPCSYPRDNYAQFAQAYTNSSVRSNWTVGFARPTWVCWSCGACDSSRPRTNVHRRADPYCAQLRELAPKTAPAYCAQSIVSFRLGIPVRPKRSGVRRRGRPEVSAGPHNVWVYARAVGKPDEGRAQLELSRSVRPSKVTVYRMLGQHHYAQRDYTNAIAWYKAPWDGSRITVLLTTALASVIWLWAIMRTRSLILKQRNLLSSTNDIETRHYYDDTSPPLFKQAEPRGYWELEWRQTQNDPNTGFREGHHSDSPRGYERGIELAEQVLRTHEHDAGEYETPLVSCFTITIGMACTTIRDSGNCSDKVGFTKVMSSSQPRRSRT